MQKDQIRMSSPGQAGLRANPVDSSLLLGDFACRFGFGTIALTALLSLKPGLCNEQTTIEQLAYGIGEIDMGFVFKQVVDGVRSRQGGSDFVGRGKGGAHIATSIPGNLRMIFEIQQELFFHLATERLPRGPDVSCFEARNPSRNALAGNFEQVDATHSRLRHGMTPSFSVTSPLTTHQTNFHLLMQSI